MALGNKIAFFRKQKGMTQEVLAQQLEVTNQAVSKWESCQCCPDIELLPRIADIFAVSIDELFDRKPKPEAAELPWEDDETLRAVLYVGRKLIGGHPAAENIQFFYEGPAVNVQSDFSVVCDDVAGNVTAGVNVTCDEVSGNVYAGRDVTCDCAEGSVTAGRDVHCDEICGSTICAGANVYCDHMEP